MCIFCVCAFSGRLLYERVHTRSVCSKLLLPKLHSVMEMVCCWCLQFYAEILFLKLPEIQHTGNALSHSLPSWTLFSMLSIHLFGKHWRARERICWAEHILVEFDFWVGCPDHGIFARCLSRRSMAFRACAYQKIVVWRGFFFVAMELGMECVSRLNAFDRLQCNGNVYANFGGMFFLCWRWRSYLVCVCEKCVGILEKAISMAAENLLFYMRRAQAIGSDVLILAHCNYFCSQPTYFRELVQSTLFL